MRLDELPVFMIYVVWKNLCEFETWQHEILASEHLNWQLDPILEMDILSFNGEFASRSEKFNQVSPR